MEALNREERRVVVRLLTDDSEHPDPEVRALGHAWAHHPRWDGWVYRLPGWLNPWVGLVLVLVGVELRQLAIVAAGVLITAWGLRRWNTHACARAIRRVYSPPR